ncbi:MAG TPA: hypothetical protein VGA04_35600, partial [Streptosporangiaceae bacterium]
EAGPRSRDVDSAVFERYGMDSVVRRIDDLYEQVLAQRPGRVRRAVARRTPTAPQTLPPASPVPEASAAGQATDGGG